VFSQEIKTIDQTFESGIQFYDFTALPVLRIFELEPNSSFYNVLKPNDLVLSVNQKQIFSRQQFLQNLNQTARSTIEVLRNGQKIEIDFENSFYPVMIYSFTSDSLAATSGLLPNDIITNVNGHEVFKFNDILDNLKPNTQNEFKVIRQGQELSLTARTDEEGKMGAMLIALESGEIGAFVSFPDFMNFSIVGNQKIPFYLAPVEALAECYRLSKLTIAMLGQVVSSIFTEFNVPEGIAGPVGIWQITDHYVKQGFLPLMRLCALLSLSLAVINIMPFPALDGGRLMFIIYEIFSGRKPNQNVESIIHFVGFILLILLLFVVTFKDITRLFE
jgi:regulator of sigma E protease